MLTDETRSKMKWDYFGNFLFLAILFLITEKTLAVSINEDSVGIVTDETQFIANAKMSERVISLPGLISDQGVYSGGTLRWVGQSSGRVGGATGTQDGALIFVFQLPSLGVGGSIISASLDINLLRIANSPQGNVDLYGLGFRNTPTVLAGDYYQGPLGGDLTGVSEIQDDFSTQASAIGRLTSNETGKVNLSTYINAQYQAGASAGDYIFIRLNPDAAEVTNYHYWEFSTANSSNAPFITLTLSNGDNLAPIASAGPDQVFTDSDQNGSEEVILDGIGSSDSDGTIVSYAWREDGNLLATGSQPNVSFAVGTHLITLLVTDNNGVSGTDEVSIIVNDGAGLQNPIANSGPDQTVTDSDQNGLEEVILDGTGSSDSDGAIVSYEWREDGNLLATGSQPNVSLAVGTHLITLEVLDNNGFTGSDAVMISINTLTAERSLTLPGLVNDQGVYSGGTLRWVGQSSGRVGGATGTQDGALIFVFQLPSLGVGGSIISASLDINLLRIANSPQGNVDLYGLGFRNTPTVLAGDYYQGPLGGDLTGVSEIQDDFSTQASAIGRLTSNETGKVNLSTYINAQYQAGASAGDYIFIRLNPDAAEVTNYHYWEFSTANSSNAPFITLTLSNGDNLAPIASAGPDQVFTDSDQNGSEEVILDGIGSSDSDGTIVSYAWREDGNLLATGSQPNVSFAVGTHLITLLVTDNNGAVATDEVSISVSAFLELQDPIANAGPDQIVLDSDQNGLEVVILDGTRSSSDGNIVSYEWRKDGVVLATGSQPNVSLELGTHLITLEVTDNNGAHAADDVTITVGSSSSLTADAGEDQLILDRENDGFEFVVVEGKTNKGKENIISYQWHENGQLLSNEAIAKINLAVGSHFLTLTVIDNENQIATNTVNITINGVLGNFQRLNLKQIPESDRFVRPMNKVWPNNPGEVNISLWEDDKFAAVSITIDDNIQPDHEWWVEMGDKYDWKFTWFIIVNRLLENSNNAFFGSWPEFQVLSDQGHDVQSHTMTHQTNDDLRPEQEMIVEYRDSLASIQQKIINNNPISFAWPSGKFNRSIASLFATSGRGTTGAPNKPERTDYLNVSSISDLRKDHLDAILFGTSGISWMGNNRYKRGWLSSHFHLLKDRATMQVKLDYLYQQSHDLWVGLYKDIALYGQERDTATIIVETNNPSMLSIDLSDEMDDELFNYPLTLKVKLYSHWNNVDAVQNGKDLDLIILNHGGEKFALIKARPDKGVITVTPSNVANLPPISNAGSNQEVIDIDNKDSVTIKLDGSNSFDTNGFIFKYEWRVNGLVIASVSQPTIQLGEGVHNIELVVTDNSGDSDTDGVTISINP